MIAHDFSLLAEDRRRSSFERAMSSTARLFAFGDKKWPELLLPSALRQMEDDLLTCAINLRRVLEGMDRDDLSEVVPYCSEYSERAPEDYEKSLWRILGCIVHHQSMDPFILRDGNFFQGASGRFAAFLVCDVEVQSDRAKIVINVPGFAIAAANELGREFKRSA